MSELAGLDQLDQRVNAAAAAAGRSRRYVPTPKHPKSPPQQHPEPPVGRVPAIDAAPLSDAGLLTLTTPEKVEPGVVAEGALTSPRRRGRVRPTQVHLDETSEEHLSVLKKRAVNADVPLTSSAVLRMALADLVARYGYNQIIQMFADDADQPRPGRPRL